MKLTDEQIAMLSPAEQAVYNDAQAAYAAGRDPLREADLDLPAGHPDAAPLAPNTPAAAAPAPAAAGDNDTTKPPPPPAPAPAAAASPAPAPGPAPAPAPAQADTDPAQAPAAAAPTPAAPPPQQQPSDAPLYKPATEQSLNEMRAKRTELRAQIAAIDAKWGDGEITPEERLAQIQPLLDQVDDITGALAVSQTLSAANEQSAYRAQQQIIQAIAARGAAQGLDYANSVELQAQFNAAINSLEANPKMAHLTFAEIAERAHQVVAISNGLTVSPPPAPAAAPAAAPTPAPAAQGRPVPAAPVTLRNMPAAEVPNQGFEAGSITQQVLSGTPDQMEANFARLTKAQREQLLARGG